MTIVCRPVRKNAESAWMRTQRLNVKALSVGSLGIVKVGDIFEAILGLLLLDYDSKASFKSPHQAQFRLHEIADSSVFAAYFAVITELYVLMRAAQQRYPSIQDDDECGMSSVLT